jgi:hypothetical protein
MSISNSTVYIHCALRYEKPRVSLINYCQKLHVRTDQFKKSKNGVGHGRASVYLNKVQKKELYSKEENE